MNNALVFVDLSRSQAEESSKERLQKEESRLVRILESLQVIQKSKEWSSLKTEVFDNLVNVLEKDLRTEAELDNPDPKKLNRLSGELKWARRYSDLSRFESEKRIELQRIRLQLYGKQSE